MKEDIRREDDACIFKILPAQKGQAKGEISIGKKRGDTVSTLTLLPWLTFPCWHCKSC